MAGTSIQAASSSAAASSSSSVHEEVPPSVCNSGQIALRSRDPSDKILSAVNATGSLQVITFALRHMAVIARRRNAYNLMAKVVCTCKEMGLSLDTILEPPWDKEADLDLHASSHPLEFLQLCSESRGYFFLRTIDPSGRNTFFANAAFEHDLVSLDACRRRYDRNEGELASLFLHPDDLDTCHETMGNTWRTAAQTSRQLTSSERWLRVRVHQSRICRYIECWLRVTVRVDSERGWVSAALELLPCSDVPEPPSLTGTPTTLVLPQPPQPLQQPQPPQQPPQPPQLPKQPVTLPLPEPGTAPWEMAVAARELGGGSDATARNPDEAFVEAVLGDEDVEGLLGSDPAALEGLLQSLVRDESDVT